MKSEYMICYVVEERSKAAKDLELAHGNDHESRKKDMLILWKAKSFSDLKKAFDVFTLNRLEGVRKNI